ncbi:MAG: ATP-binding protein [Candidatus Margulisiibacteriota bacterium]|jgi:hypothetical protein
MSIKREIESAIIETAQKYPVLTITGPRQSGKTTLVKMLFPEHTYISLENPDIRDFALNDPRGFFNANQGALILDEIQQAPLLLSYLQEIVDNTKNNAQFILTGSQQFELMKGVTQSLAGRTALIKLLPFNFNEIQNYSQKKEPLDYYLLKGFYPRIWDHDLPPYKAYMDYFETYIQRDLRQLILIKELSLFRKFVRLCAGRIGQIFQANNLANEVGVSLHTINSWLSILETSYIIFLLPPYYENLGKRLIKSPKLYFYDVGLAAYLLGIEDQIQLGRDRLRGALIENLVIMELIKKRFNQLKDINLYFYRDQAQKEIDVLIKKADRLNLVEIKASSTFNQEFCQTMAYLKQRLPDKIDNSYLIYTGDREFEINQVNVINYFSAALKIDL